MASVLNGAERGAEASAESARRPPAGEESQEAEDRSPPHPATPQLPALWHLGPHRGGSSAYLAPGGCDRRRVSGHPCTGPQQGEGALKWLRVGIGLSVQILGEQDELIFISTDVPDTLLGLFPPCRLVDCSTTDASGRLSSHFSDRKTETAAMPEGNLVSGPALHAAKLSPGERRASRAAPLGARLFLSVML